MYTYSNEKALSIIVCYFSEEQGESIVQHYDSVTLTIVNAKTVLQCVIDLLAKDKIPENNLVSVLPDSASFMRGLFVCGGSLTSGQLENPFPLKTAKNGRWGSPSSRPNPSYVGPPSSRPKTARKIAYRKTPLRLMT